MNALFRFTFYIYIDIYYDLLFTVIHNLFVWVGSRKYYIQYIVFSSQYFPIFFIMLGGAPTSICHFFHLSICLLHTISQEPCVIWSQVLVHICKMMISPGGFLFFLNFDFLGCEGGKRAKNSPKWKITITSVMCHIAGTVWHMIMIFGTLL